VQGVGWSFHLEDGNSNTADFHTVPSPKRVSTLYHCLNSIFAAIAFKILPDLI
jgi:hypothetical protein